MEESGYDVGSLEHLLLYADEHYLAGKLPMGDHLGKKSVGELYRSPGCLHTHTRLSSVPKTNRDSSLNTTFCQSVTFHIDLAWYHCRRSCRCSGVKGSALKGRLDLRFASARCLEIVCGTIATATSAHIVERVTVGSTSAFRRILRSSLLVVFLVAPDPVSRQWRSPSSTFAFGVTIAGNSSGKWILEGLSGDSPFLPEPLQPSCRVIYSQFGLAIHQNDHQARRRFVEWAQNEIAVVRNFHKRILFSDEAHFWVNGYVNKQNCRIWSEANPQVYVETPLHPEKLTDVQELWFQQDGPTCHTARATIDLLKDTFGDHLISRFGPVNWPPRSCDLTPLDYFLWGYVKSLVYADKPQTLDHLEDNIRRVIADIRPQMLEKVIENWTSRLDYIRASRKSYARNHI
ncbi:uncharacterized protein TNCV_507911 [Trichonephila clavipes]|nr:uncharacterized protein TNCV_507911 [Trichonephila clavipes]